MRVCQVVSSLCTGGMERMVCDMLEGMRGETTDHGLQTLDRRLQTKDQRLQTEGAKLFESCLFCTDAKGELYESAPVTAKACGHRKPGWFIIDWRIVRQVVRFVREQKVDILHAHNHAPNLYCTIVSLLTGVPMIVTRHGQGYKTLRWRILTYLLAMRAKKVVFVSEDAKRVAIANHTVPAKKAVVIHNGVDTRRFTPRETTDIRLQTADRNNQNPESRSQKSEIRRRLGIPADAVVIGSVGRLSPEKNYPLLVRAFASLSRKVAGCQVAELSREASPSSVNNNPTTQQPNNITTFLLLVGDGPERGRIEVEMGRYGIKDCCLIAGMQADVRPWLRAMDIFCLSSDTEGLSISLLEAGACGLPSVVTDVGGNKEVVDGGRTGLVVPKGGEHVFKDALSKLSSDVSLRERMGDEACIRVSGCFATACMLRAYEGLYVHVLR